MPGKTNQTREDGVAKVMPFFCGEKSPSDCADFKTSSFYKLICVNLRNLWCKNSTNYCSNTFTFNNADCADFTPSYYY